jgi:hypothetical protein
LPEVSKVTSRSIVGFDISRRCFVASDQLNQSFVSDVRKGRNCVATPDFRGLKRPMARAGKAPRTAGGSKWFLVLFAVLSIGVVMIKRWERDANKQKVDWLCIRTAAEFALPY